MKNQLPFWVNPVIKIDSFIDRIKNRMHAKQLRAKQKDNTANILSGYDIEKLLSLSLLEAKVDKLTEVVVQQLSANHLLQDSILKMVKDLSQIANDYEDAGSLNQLKDIVVAYHPNTGFFASKSLGSLKDIN